MQQLQEHIVERLTEVNIPFTINDDNIDCTTKVSLWNLREIIGRQGVSTTIAIIYPYNDVIRIHITEDGSTYYHKDNYIAGYNYSNEEYHMNVSAPSWFVDVPSTIIEVMVKLGIHSDCVKWNSKDKYRIKDCIHNTDTIRKLCSEYKVTEENGKIYITNK